MVSGRSQNPSRKPRTAVSAATRPPLAPPIPSAIAATTSRRGCGSSQPNTAPAKSSLRSRGPVSEANPTLALTPDGRSAIAVAPIVSAAPARAARLAPSVSQSATIVKKVAAGGRGEGHRESAGLAVEPIAPAVGGVAPRDFGVVDAGRIGIDGAAIVVDSDL